jgi:hypothetical protein
MLATVGLVVPEFVRVPGEQFSFEAIPKVIDAHDALLDSSMKQILLWVSFAEVCTLAALSNMNEFDREPGNFGFDPLGIMPKDEAGKKAMKLKELKNGRLVSFPFSFLWVFVSTFFLDPVQSVFFSSKRRFIFISLRAIMTPPPGDGRNRRHDPRIHRHGTRIPVPIKKIMHH